MDDMSSADQYIIVPSCYIKEELDISTVTDYYEDETYYNNYVEQSTSENIDQQCVNDDIAYQDMINQNKADQDLVNQDAVSESSISIKKEYFTPMVDKENCKVSEKYDDKSVNSSNDRVAIMGEESDDTDVDVENDSSDNDSNNKSSLQECNNVTEDSTWEHESSEDEDFELKISDESEGDKIKSSENGLNKVSVKNNAKNKSESITDNNDFNEKQVESRTYETRNRSKNQMSTSQTAEVNSSDPPPSESNQLELQSGNDKIVTRYSLKGSEDKVTESRKVYSRVKKSIRINEAMIGFCVSCKIDVELVSCSQRNTCSRCKKIVKFKCSLCKHKVHITDTYCGMHKHVRLHHFSKKKVRDKKNNKLAQQLNSQKPITSSLVIPQKATVNAPKLVYNRELVLEDIEKFTILICLKCNEVARVYNGKISDCSSCKVKMVLTCLICSKYESSINSMYEHLHQQHKEHFSEEKDNSKSSVSQTKPKENKPNLVRKKRCLKCGRRFLSSTTAQKHAANCKYEHLKCEYCTYTTYISSNLKRHYQNVHNKIVEDNGNSNVATKSPPSTATPNNQCQVCGKIIMKLESLKNHQKYCGIEPNIQCQFCPYKTKYKGNLNSHINQNHSSKSKSVIAESNKTKTICTNQESPSIVPSKAKVNGSLSSNHIVKPLTEVAEAICLKCNERKDLVINSKERPCNKCGKIIIYRCLLCQKPYDFHQSLMYHLDSSCNPKTRYECLKCKYKTYVNNTMQKHLRIHGVKPWSLSTAHKRGKGGVDMKSSENEHFKIIYFKLADSQSDNKFQSEKQPQIKNGRIEPEDNSNVQSQNKNKTNEPEKVDFTLPDPINTYQKSQCPKCKTYVQQLKKHMIFCGVKANLGCKFCPYKTKYSFNLKAHMKNSHRKGSSKKITNSSNENKTKIETQVPNNIIMNKNFKKNDSSQLKAEDLMLSYCFKCDASKETMKYASKCRVCESQLTYRCAKCNMEAPTRDDLRVHVREHWRKPYVCSKCSKAFGHVENLRLHDKMCTVESPVISADSDVYSK